MALPSLQNPTVRMLTFGTLLAAASLFEAITGAQPGATAFAMAGAATMKLAGSVSGETFGGDFSEKLARRLTGHEELLRNHDLTEAVGQALSKALLQALDTLVPPMTTTSAEGVRKLAGVVEERWKALVFQTELSPDGLREMALPTLFAVVPEKAGAVEALDTSTWMTLLNHLKRETPDATFASFSINDAEQERLAALLPEIFPRALREVIKHDAEGNGKAHTGLT